MAADHPIVTALVDAGMPRDTAIFVMQKMHFEYFSDVLQPMLVGAQGVDATFICDYCRVLNTSPVRVLGENPGGEPFVEVVDVYARCDGCGHAYLLDAEKERLTKLWKTGQITMNQARRRLQLAPYAAPECDLLYTQNGDEAPVPVNKPSSPKLEDMFGGRRGR